MSRGRGEGREQQLATAARAVAILARQFDRTCQEADLSLSQYRLLLYVRIRPQRASELAERVAVRRPTLTALVDGLVEAEYLRRASVKSDRRGVSLELTDQGRAKLAEVEGLLAQRLGQFTRHTDETRTLTGLVDLANAIQKELEGHQEEPPPRNW